MSESPSDSERLISLEGRVQGLEVGVERIFSELREIKGAIRRETNWPLVISGIAVAIAVLVPTAGALALFVSLQIKTEVAPLSSKAEVSLRDRGELHSAVTALSASLSEFNTRERETTAEFKAKLIEVESQFASADHTRNLQQAHMLRYTALLWEKTYGQRFPEFQYYPNISQHER